MDPTASAHGHMGLELTSTRPLYECGCGESSGDARGDPRSNEYFQLCVCVHPAKVMFDRTTEEIPSV